MKSMETGRQDGGSDKNHAPFSVGKTGNISRKFLTIILKIFDKNFERLQQERLAELVDISTNHLGAIEREVKTPTMETFVKLLNVLGAEPNEVLKEVIPLTRMEHTSVVEGKLERLTPKKQESVLRMLDVIIEEMMK